MGRAKSKTPFEVLRDMVGADQLRTSPAADALAEIDADKLREIAGHSAEVQQLGVGPS